jgi:endonuclease/exonuclease/phosphatase family metal-dependent hydrolase
VRVLTYNVCYAGAEQGGHPWERRRDAVASTVRFRDPAVACLQECWQGQVADLRERLPGYEFVGEDDGVGWHTPVVYDPDRLTLDGWETFRLAPDPDQRTPAWDATFSRVVTRASFEALDCYSVHLDHEGPRARRESARLLVERVRERDRPAVLAGDLNSVPGSPPYETLAGELTDAAAAGSHGPRESYNAFEGIEGLREGRRIDHVFLAGLEPRDCGVCTDLGPDHRFPSDHCPVAARVERAAGAGG